MITSPGDIHLSELMSAADMLPKELTEEDEAGGGFCLVRGVVKCCPGFLGMAKS
jgi:hypothetical protein